MIYTMCKGKYYLWINSEAQGISRYPYSENSVRTFQLQFRGIPKAEKYLLRLESLSLTGHANQTYAIPGVNEQTPRQPAAYWPDDIPKPTAELKSLLACHAVCNISGFSSAYNYGQILGVQSAQTRNVNTIAVINPYSFRIEGQSTTGDDFQAIPLIIEPPNDGTYTVSFNGLTPERIIIGGQTTVTNTDGSTTIALDKLGDYLMCLSLQPMTSKDIDNFFPKERGCL